MKKLMLSLSLMFAALATMPAVAAVYVYCPWPYRLVVQQVGYWAWTGYGYAWISYGSQYVCVYP